MLVNASGFVQTVWGYRLLWIMGRFGGGKTSLAYRLAQEYLDQGYRLITNNLSIWADRLEDIDLDENNHLKAVVILDEGGLVFKSSKQIEMIAAYANKMDCIYIIPSYFPPTRTAQVVTCQPVVNLKAAGVPVIAYKWRCKLGGFTDSGSFFWINPGEIYGIYSRQDPGDRASDIVQFLVEKSEEYRGRYGRYDGLSEVAEITETDILRDAAEAISGAADTFTSIPIRKGRRR